jgi:hypothetical protein
MTRINLTGGTAAAPRATAEVESDTEVTRRKVAEHNLIGADGVVVESEEDADGIKYDLIGGSKPFTWNYSQANEAERKLLAIFGAKTLATNETSQIRNGAKTKGDPVPGADEQIGAVAERFALLRAGQWVDRTREGAAVRIDKDALAEAIIQVMLAAGKITDDQVGDTKAAKRQQLEDDPTYMRKARQVPEVATAYARIVGRTTATVNDL